MDFKKGIKDGMPIAVGYLSVSFGFGLMVVSEGFSVLVATIISMTNLTSAGQVAGLAVIAASGTYAEIALTQLIINLRYALMSISLSQKLDKSFTTFHRFSTAFGITDEIFAVASSKPTDINRNYMYGLITMPFIGWTGGTIMGAVAGNILPTDLKAALGIAIYGMFLAIILPVARESIGVLVAVVIAATISCIIRFVPVFDFITSGFSIIICAVIAAGLAAVFFPIKEEEEA
ncbi:MAG: AzlC family ABC transporter permease [Lachnospiraceae bacterium]|nr:AzlC family ABC transporter permease [Lachnospiraceae bacterium]